MPGLTLPPAGAGITGECTETHQEFVQEVEDTLNNGRNEGSQSVDIPDCADIYVEHEEPIIANHIIIGEFDPETMTSENMKVSPSGDLMTLSTLTGGVTEMPGVFRPDAVARAREIIGAYTPGASTTDENPPPTDGAPVPEADPSRGVRLKILYNQLSESCQSGNVDACDQLGALGLEIWESGELAPTGERPNLTPGEQQLIEDLLRELYRQGRQREAERVLEMLRQYSPTRGLETL